MQGYVRGSAWAGRDVGPRQVRVSYWILLVAALAITKLGALCWNHAIQVPLVQWLNDPSLYPNDPFVAVLERYPSALWPLVALLARVFPLEGTLLVLYVLGRAFAIWAAGRLARAFVPGSGLAVVGACALFALPIDSMVGFGTIVDTYAEQTSLAIPCFLLAAAAFHERRRFAWAAWLAFGFDLTSMYGVFALSYFAAVFALDPEYRAEWRRWTAPALLFAVLASYEIFLSFSAARVVAPDEASWLEAARARGWSHFFPLTWGWEKFAQFGAFLALLAIVLTRARRGSPRLFRHGLIWIGVAGLWLIDAFVAPYLLESRRLMMMQPARATDLLVCFGGIAMIAIAASRLATAREAAARRGWLAALAAAFCVWLVPGAWPVAGLVAVSVLPGVWNRVAPFATPRTLAWLLVAWVVFSGFDAEQRRWFRPDDLVFRGPGAATRQLAAWAERETPLDAVFLLNPSADRELDQFRGLSKRSIFTSVEDGTALYWAPDFTPEWLGRLGALGVDATYRNHWSLDHSFDDAFTGLTDASIVGLQRFYRLDYWIVKPGTPSRFPEVFATDDYRVLDVSSTNLGG